MNLSKTEMQRKKIQMGLIQHHRYIQTTIWALSHLPPHHFPPGHLRPFLLWITCPLHCLRYQSSPKAYGHPFGVLMVVQGTPEPILHASNLVASQDIKTVSLSSLAVSQASFLNFLRTLSSFALNFFFAGSWMDTSTTIIKTNSLEHETAVLRTHNLVQQLL